MDIKVENIQKVAELQAECLMKEGLIFGVKLVDETLEKTVKDYSKSDLKKIINLCLSQAKKGSKEAERIYKQVCSEVFIDDKRIVN